MWHRLSVNRLALINFIVSCLGCVASLLYNFAFRDSDVWRIVFYFCMFAYCLATLLSIAATARGKVRNDEMSYEHEGQSRSFTYLLAQVMLMAGVLLVVVFGFEVGITLSAPLLFGLSFLLYAVQSGTYLLLERVGM
jgi:hypothetical protein